RTLEEPEDAPRGGRRAGRERAERLRLSVEAREAAAVGRHPQAARPVHEHVLYRRVRERGRVGGLVAEDGVGIAVVAIQPVVRAEPDEAFGVLRDGRDGALREAVLNRQVVEHHGKRLRRRAGRRAQHAGGHPAGDQPGGTKRTRPRGWGHAAVETWWPRNISTG